MVLFRPFVCGSRITRTMIFTIHNVEYFFPRRGPSVVQQRRLKVLVFPGRSFLNMSGDIPSSLL